jgi:VCBS repeat protein
LARGPYGGRQHRRQRLGVPVILREQDPNRPGQFLAPVMLPTGLSTASVAVEELNGDGAADIVATGYDNNGNNGAVYVFYQVAAHPGTFAAAVSFPAGAGPQSVKIADMNADRLPDIAAADGSSATVMLQIPGTPGQFSPAVQVGQ